MQTETLLEYALDYAADGYQVFPVRPDTKAPIGDLAPNGMKDATTDTDTLEHWWAARPDALIGCRIPEHLVLLDIDPRHAGLDVWAALLDLYGPLTSRVHFSGRGDGGFHIWLQHPDAKLSVKPLNDWGHERGLGHAVTDTKWTAGIDLLHHGHRYTILPPSPHPETGAPYTWASETEPAECPPWLAELITAPEPTVTDHLPALPTVAHQGDSVADWYSNSQSWRRLLGAHGWEIVSGDGESDGSRWRHPNATNAFSATITHNCLFVYSPNTPFDETYDGEPHGYTLFNAYALLEHRGDGSAAARQALSLPGAPQAPQTDMAAFIEANSHTDAPVAPDGQPVNPLAASLVDWHELWTTDHAADDFLCAPILARGRGHALYAKAKTGKSLVVLEMAAALATGKPFLSHHGEEPVRVLYIDFEMTPADLHERLEAFGYGPEDDLGHLYYVQFPVLSPIDTSDGGHSIMLAAAAWSPEVVIIDTTARAVQGEENAMETFRDAYRHTFGPLKAKGITTLRVDHAGKDAERGQRGSSAKNDDVDVVWELSRKASDGDNEQLTLKATHRRMGWIPEVVEIERTDGGAPMHRLPAGVGQWPEGTKALADQLDEAGAPPNVTKREARSEYGISARDIVIGAAIRYRKERKMRLFTSAQSRPEPTGTMVPGTKSGNQRPPGSSTGSDLRKYTGTKAGTNGNQPLTPTGNRVPPRSGEPGTRDTGTETIDYDPEGLI